MRTVGPGQGEPLEMELLFLLEPSALKPVVNAESDLVHDSDAFCLRLVTPVEEDAPGPLALATRNGLEQIERWCP